MYKEVQKRSTIPFRIPPTLTRTRRPHYKAVPEMAHLLTVNATVHSVVRTFSVQKSPKTTRPGPAPSPTSPARGRPRRLGRHADHLAVGPAHVDVLQTGDVAVGMRCEMPGYRKERAIHPGLVNAALKVGDGVHDWDQKLERLVSQIIIVPNTVLREKIEFLVRILPFLGTSKAIAGALCRKSNSQSSVGWKPVARPADMIPKFCLDFPKLFPSPVNKLCSCHLLLPPVEIKTPINCCARTWISS